MVVARRLQGAPRLNARSHDLIGHRIRPIEALVASSRLSIRSQSRSWTSVAATASLPQVVGESSDFELLDQWGSGDRRAGAALFARHFDALYAFLHKRCIDSVDDLAQETLLACVANRARFRRDASFRTYLLQIARYRLYAQYKRISGMADNHAIESAANDSSPSGHLSRMQDERLVLHAVRRLPLNFQVVLKLSFFDELSGSQIAELLEIPEATVRSRLWRALKRLKEETLAGGSAGVRETASELRHWAERIHHSFSTQPLTREP